MYSDELYQPEKRKNDDKLFAIAKRDLKHPDGSELTDEQIWQVLSFMRKMADIAIKKFLRKQEFKKKLEEAGGGFPNEEKGRYCLICGEEAFGENSWIDSNGLKCMDCQEAIRNNIIPVSIIGDKNSFYTGKELRKKLKLNQKILQTWITGKVIKQRIIPKSNGEGIHLQLFLMKDNKRFLPPKEMLEDRMAIITDEKGVEHCKAYPWYCWVNPKEYLAEYGISYYMMAQEEVSDK